MKKLLIAITTAGLLFGMNACKKDDSSSSSNNNTSGSSCLLKSYTTNDTGYVAYLYDSQNRLIKQFEYGPSMSDTLVSTATYDGNACTITQNGTPLGTFYLNAKGAADSAVIDLQGFSVMMYNTYNTAGNLTKSVMNINFGGMMITQTETNTWTNGNLTSKLATQMLGATALSSTTTTYEYYTDKTNTADAAINKSQFSGVDSKNPIKKMTEDDGQSTTITDYVYTYDTKGNTIQKTETSDGVSSTNKFNWTCK